MSFLWGAVVVALLAPGGHAAGAEFAAGARAHGGGDHRSAFREWMAQACAGDAIA